MIDNHKIYLKKKYRNIFTFQSTCKSLTIYPINIRDIYVCNIQFLVSRLSTYQ